MAQTSRSESLIRIGLLASLKSAKLAKIFKAFKVLKFSKVLVSFVSMGISALVYGWGLGIWFGIGFVLMLFVHEMGHIMAMNRKGIPTRGPVFIPMLGAVIFAPRFKNAQEEAYVGYGGPLIGGLGALAAFLAWKFVWPESRTLLLVSYLAAYLNLFNLLPLRPLDGGRITQIVGSWFVYIGIGTIFVLTWLIRDPSILVLWILILHESGLRPPKLTAAIGILCEVSMIGMFALGWSSEPNWAKIVDIMLATFLNFLLVGNVLWGPSDTPSDHTHPVIEPMAVRIRWFVYYIVLAAALVTLMTIQMPLIDELIKK